MTDWEKECATFVDLAARSAQLPQMPAGPDKAISHEEIHREAMILVDGPALAPLSPEQKKILFRALTEKFEGRDRATASTELRKEDGQRQRQRLETECLDLRDENGLLRDKLRQITAVLLGEPAEVTIDADVIEYAGIFEKALRSGEETLITAGVRADAAWRCMRKESHEIFCTASERYATLRRFARATTSLAVPVLAQCLQSHFESLPSRYADVLSRLFLSVCDTGREFWCRRYEASELISQDELEKMKEISQQPREGGQGL